MMFRKELVELLKQQTTTASELARRFEVRPKAIEEELEHIRKSVKQEGMMLKITPARCRKCDFIFNRDKISKPGKCPKCKGTWIKEPEFHIG